VFDFSFGELLVIGVVALVVIGPEKLPKVARTGGALFGRLQRYVSDVKADINREIEASELKELKSTMDDAAQSFQQTMNSHANEIQDEIRKTEEEFNRLSNPLMHFGLAGGGAAAGSAGAVSSVEALDAEPATDPDQSPQLELGLGGGPGPATVNAAAATAAEPEGQPRGA
jgi:sec-independent protein translocase protein TatB